MKLAKELSRRSTGRTMYVLDEPTTGLHFHDVRQPSRRPSPAGRSGKYGHRHRARPWTSSRPRTGSSDLGPEGGTGGGSIVAEGTPEEVAAIQRQPYRRLPSARSLSPKAAPRAPASGESKTPGLLILARARPRASHTEGHWSSGPKTGIVHFVPRDSSVGAPCPAKGGTLKVSTRVGAASERASARWVGGAPGSPSSDPAAVSTRVGAASE